MSRNAATGNHEKFATELEAALTVLDSVIALRQAERKPGDTNSRIRFDGTDLIPEQRHYLTEGPLSALCRHVPLSDLELLILIASVAPSIDERYVRLLSQMSDRAEPAAVTGEALRNLCGSSWATRQEATQALAPHGVLRQLQLIEIQTDPLGPLAGLVSVPGQTLTGITGAPPIAPELSVEFPANPLRTVHTIDDLVLTRSARSRLDDVLNRLDARQRVLGEWGVANHHDGAAGLIVLLHGPPGTGKSMTAAVLGAEAGLTALRVDLSTLVSKYIGETAKNLETVFRYAEQNPCLLFFDEADSVFSKRGEVSDARDKYANQEISYLLQRIETFPGLVVLASNLLTNIDAAFLRRIDVMVELGPPDVRHRRRLWEKVFAPGVPRDELDYANLAERFQLTGAQIRDAAIEATYQAASNGGTVTADHLTDAIKLQFDKSGLMSPT